MDLVHDREPERPRVTGTAPEPRRDHENDDTLPLIEPLAPRAPRPRAVDPNIRWSTRVDGRSDSDFL